MWTPRLAWKPSWLPHPSASWHWCSTGTAQPLSRESGSRSWLQNKTNGCKPKETFVECTQYHPHGVQELLHRHGNCLKRKTLKTKGSGGGGGGGAPTPPQNFFPPKDKIYAIWGSPQVIFTEIKVTVASQNHMPMCSCSTSQILTSRSTNLCLP